MTYLHNKISAFLLTAIFTTCTAYSFADEAQSEDKPQQANKNSRDGYYLSIGAGYRNLESPGREEVNGWQVVFNGRYQWKGLFAELALDPSSAKSLPAVGYNFYTTDHWNLDLIGAGTAERVEFNYHVNGEAKQISSKSPRGVGFRAIGSWGNTLLQVIALPYFHEDFQSNSEVDYASLWLGHRWQIKNWSVSGLVGAKYRSAGLMNYHFGVAESEADAVLNAYEPSSGIDYTAQIDLTYPVSKNVLFQVYSRGTIFSDEFLRSPIIGAPREFHGRPEKEHEFGVLLNYVF